MRLRVFEKAHDGGMDRLGRDAGDVRREDGVLEPEQRRRRRGFAFVDIQGGGPDSLVS